MMHGPCGASRPSSPCMEDGKCSKYFPKNFTSATTITDDGFVLYRRRDSGISVEKNGSVLDNRHVVPYNLNMLLKYQAHINVERCHSTSMIKYLFKYICKGHDRAMVGIHPTSQSSIVEHAEEETTFSAVDEIRHFLDCRYLAPPEAAWRLFVYDIHYSNPTVERLPVHLPFENNIVFSDSQPLDEIAGSDNYGHTKLMAWLDINKVDAVARTLTYTEITTKFVWNQRQKNWSRRKKGRRLARMLFVHPTASELYYLRMLLNVVRGPTSFEEIRVVNGSLCPTFKDACSTLGLLDNDDEWLYTLQEAAVCASSQQIRKMFVDIILYSEITNVTELWNACWCLMGDDIMYNLRSQNHIPEFNCTDSMLKDHILYELQDIFLSRGSSLESVRLPQPSEQRIYEGCNRLLAQQLSYNTIELREHVHELLASLNSEQKIVFQQVLFSVQNKQGKLFFVYGHGGRGKTHLWSVLTAKLRSEGKIVLTVASSGISSLLLQGGVTAHSRFKIPIELNERSTCNIKKNTQLARLISVASLIVWDEAPMSNKICFEALDRTMRDILSNTDPMASIKPFGGMTMVLGGDFRQTLPVVPRGSRYDTISASIVNSYLWNYFRVFVLTENMRLARSSNNPVETHRIANFADWLLLLGNGQLETKALYEATEPEWIKIPDNLLIRSTGDDHYNRCHPDITHSYQYDDFLRHRAILAPKNVIVDCLNERNITSNTRRIICVSQC